MDKDRNHFRVTFIEFLHRYIDEVSRDLRLEIIDRLFLTHQLALQIPLLIEEYLEGILERRSGQAKHPQYLLLALLEGENGGLDQEAIQVFRLRTYEARLRLDYPLNQSLQPVEEDEEHRRVQEVEHGVGQRYMHHDIIL